MNLTSTRFTVTQHGAIACWVLLYLYTSSAIACNGPPAPGAEQALSEANMVVVAEVVSTALHPTLGDTSGRFLTENAVFKVLEAFKGPYRRGDLVKIVSNLGPGQCGMSATNHPVSIESIGRDGKPFATTLSGVWLIYGYGDGPYDLDIITRTKPMEFGGAAEVKQLRQLVSQRRRPDAHK
jgi:hypothetical protein